MNKASGCDAIPAEPFQVLKMVLLECCTQYASKFGKLSSSHRTGKVGFHSNPKERQSQRMFKLPYNCTHFTAYLTYMQSTSYELTDWMKHKLESRLQGEISVTSDMQMTENTLMARREEELKSLLLKVKGE